MSFKKTSLCLVQTDLRGLQRKKIERKNWSKKIKKNKKSLDLINYF